MTTKIEMSFHPSKYSLSWLEQRFEKLCQIKKRIDILSTKTKLKHTPLHPKIIYKFLGRHSNLASLFVQNNIGAIKSFLKFQDNGDDDDDDDEQQQDNDLKSLLSLAICITGPVRDAKLLVQSLKTSQKDLYVDCLQLFECVHLTFFDKDVYADSNDFIVDHICDITKSTTFNENSYYFSLQNTGLQTETMLDNIRAIVVSSSVGSYKEIKYGKRDCLYSTYDAYYDSLRSRCFINSNEKQYEKLQ